MTASRAGSDHPGESLRSSPAFGPLLREVGYPDIAKLELAAVVLQAEVPFERLVLDLGDRRLIDVDDLLAVERDADARANAFDVHRVPFADGPARVAGGLDIAVERTGAVLVRRLAGVVEELDLV